MDGNVSHRCSFSLSECMFSFSLRFNASGYNFYMVAVHAIGHALGLEHNFDQNSIMYPTYRLLSRGSILPDYDRRTIQALYAAPTCGEGKSQYNSPSNQCSPNGVLWNFIKLFTSSQAPLSWKFKSKDHTKNVWKISPRLTTSDKFPNRIQLLNY